MKKKLSGSDIRPNSDKMAVLGQARLIVAGAPPAWFYVYTIQQTEINPPVYISIKHNIYIPYNNAAAT